MPKSKRDKKVSLTQTKRKGMALKTQLMEQVKEHADLYARIFTFRVENMRNTQLKQVRQEWKHSRFFFGKNKVMASALGRDEASGYKPNIHKITARLVGQTGLLFTNKTKEEVVTWFDEYRQPDYARSGTDALQEVVLSEGPLEGFSHAMEPQLRQLGLPTTLKKGIINLTMQHTVCKKGEALKPEQARILKLFGHKMAEFHVTIESVWSNDGAFEKFKERSQPVRPTKVELKGPQDGDVMEEEEEEMEKSGDDDDDLQDEGSDDAQKMAVQTNNSGRYNLRRK